MEATAAPALSIIPLPATTANSPEGLGDSQKTTVITGNDATQPAELFASFLSELTALQDSLTPELTDSDSALQAIGPISATEVLPLTGKSLPLSIHAITIDPDTAATDAQLPVVTLTDTIDQADLQALDDLSGLTDIRLVTQQPATDQAAIAATPVATIVANAVLPKQSQTSRQLSDVVSIDQQLSTDKAPAPVLTASREIPADLVIRSDQQQIQTPQPLQPIPADSSGQFVTSALTATQPASTATTTQPSFTINHPVADAQWGDSLGQRVIWMTENGMGRAEIRLNPAELGPLNVSVTMSNDEAKVAFTVQHGATRELVEAALPRLREMFAAQGLELTDASVSQQSPQDRRQAGDTGDSSGRSNYNESENSTGIDGSDTVQSAQIIREGLIDTYV